MSEPRTAGPVEQLLLRHVNLYLTKEAAIEIRDLALAIEAEAAAREAVALDALRESVVKPSSFHESRCNGMGWYERADWTGCDCGTPRLGAILADPSPAAAHLLAVVEAARALTEYGPDDDILPDEEWEPSVLAIRAALRALDGEA